MDLAVQCELQAPPRPKELNMPTGLIQSYWIDAGDLPHESVLFGSTVAMREVQGQVLRIVHNDLPVLVRGESGTGKETIARYLHSQGSRSHLPFVRVDCSAMSEGGWDDEFSSFHGDELRSRGTTSSEGSAGVGGCGTLYLHEVGELSWDSQVKLLDLLEDSQPDAGGRGTRARIVCSTSRDLERAVEQRKFRRDLFYRIDVISLHLTPLRERQQDIPVLCRYFLEKLALKLDKPVPEFSAALIERLEQCPWPGNLRELDSRIARLVVQGSGNGMEKGLSGRGQPVGLRGAGLRVRRAAGKVVNRRPERAAVLRALRANQWNQRKAAEELKMSYRAFLAWMRETRVPRRNGIQRVTLPKSTDRGEL
jgi:DNA-binding NtrC family response regulator